MLNDSSRNGTDRRARIALCAALIFCSCRVLAESSPVTVTPPASDLSGESSSTTSEILASGGYDIVPGPRARYSDDELEELGLCSGDEECEPAEKGPTGPRERASDDPTPDGSGTR